MLKPRQQKILEFMKNEISTKGYPPTVREICAAIGIKSTSTVHKDIETLVSEGYLKKDPSKPRALMVVDPKAKSGHVDAAGSSQEPKGETLPYNVVEVPVVGRVAAGEPIFAEQNIEDSFPLPDRFVNGGNNFMLRVKGESMIEAGIMDGDIVVLRQQDTAENGEIVAAMVPSETMDEGEATLKRIFYEDGRVRLQPENHTMEPIYADDAAVLGKLVALFRQF